METYTEEEVKKLIWSSRKLFEVNEHTPNRYLRGLFKNWFEENKKK